MVDQTNLGIRSVQSYSSLVEASLLEEIYVLASDLKGARVAHINATSNGGGVAEILRSLIPLYRNIGMDASWLVLRGDESFFRVTKRLHNTLQGAKGNFSAADWDVYMKWNQRNAASLCSSYDVVFVHDPQPAAIRQFATAAATHWVWRCHIDTSAPNAEVWRVLTDLVSGYDATIFSAPDFVGPGLNGHPVAIIHPAIDPLIPKNRPMPYKEALAIVARFGLDPRRPFISQISRFDRWKDPLGVIACFGRLRELHPGLQLALLGNFADDDPEGLTFYKEVLKAAQKLTDVHVIKGLTDLVNPFQCLSRVVLQKSLREGFGLTVTEALWKGTPVVAGNVGGIRLQISDGVGGYLVDNAEECVSKVDHLLTHEEERMALGEAGREHVRLNFLLPRLLRDELKLVRGLLSGTTVSPRSSAQAWAA